MGEGRSIRDFARNGTLLVRGKSGTTDGVEEVVKRVKVGQVGVVGFEEGVDPLVADRSHDLVDLHLNCRQGCGLVTDIVLAVTRPVCDDLGIDSTVTENGGVLASNARLDGGRGVGVGRRS